MTDIDYVRVKDSSTGHQYTTSRTDAEISGLEILDKPAVDQIGRPLPAKFNDGPTSGTVGKRSGSEAATNKKENT